MMMVVILVCVLLSVVFSIFPSNINPWLIASFWIVINALDAHSTYLFMKQGHREGNPVMSWLFKNMGFGPTIILKMITAILIAYLLIEFDINPDNILALSIVFTLVVLGNYRLARIKATE